MKKFDKPLMETAKIWANMSYCVRLKVGAVLALDGRIIGTGYNGTLNGTENCCEEIVGQETCSDCEGKGYFEIEGVVISDCERCGGVGKINTLKTKEEVLHAEQNVITFCAKNGLSTNNTTMYITAAPCTMCAKLIVQSGIKEVVYLKDYRSDDGFKLLKKGGVIVRKYEED